MVHFLKLLAKQPDHPNRKRHIFYNSTIGKWSYKKFWFYCMVSISLISATIQIQHKWIEFHSTNNLEFTTKGTFSVYKYKVLVQLWIILWFPVIQSILIHYYLFVFPEEMSYLFGFRLVGVIQLYCVCWKSVQMLHLKSTDSGTSLDNNSLITEPQFYQTRNTASLLTARIFYLFSTDVVLVQSQSSPLPFEINF